MPHARGDIDREIVDDGIAQEVVVLPLRTSNGTTRGDDDILYSILNLGEGAKHDRALTIQRYSSSTVFGVWLDCEI